MRLTIACLIAALPATAATVATAEEFGTVTADLGGEERTFYTITAESSDGETAATAEMRMQGMFTSLSIQAHPEPRFTATDVFTLDLTWMGDFAPGAAPNSVEMMHMPEGMSGGVWTSEGAGTPTEAALEIDPEGGSVSGTFSGELCYQEGIRADPDPNNCKPVSGAVESGVLVIK